jgi:hypothetical protein
MSHGATTELVMNWLNSLFNHMDQTNLHFQFILLSITISETSSLSTLLGVPLDETVGLGEEGVVAAHAR